MSARGDVSPSTLGVELREHGVHVEYLDGHTVVYRGVPEAVSGTLATSPGKETHILVTDPTETEGVMLYVNDLKTHDDILESTGVGRIMLSEGDEEEVFPGVTVRRTRGYRCEVEADPEVARGRVFVFVEDDWGEESYELVAPADNGDGDGGDGGGEGAGNDVVDGSGGVDGGGGTGATDRTGAGEGDG